MSALCFFVWSTHNWSLKHVHIWKSNIFVKDSTIAFQMSGRILQKRVSIESRIRLIQTELVRDFVIFDLRGSYHNWWNKLNFYCQRDESIESHESQNIT